MALDFIVVYCRLLSFIVFYFEVLRLYVIDAPCVMAEELFSRGALPLHDYLLFGAVARDVREQVNS